MKIISRYVLKEHIGPLLFSLTALTSLLLLNYIAKQFGNLVGKGLGWSVIAEFFLLSVPFTVAMTLPMAVLVSTLYAFSRLAAENEITAMKASGVSMLRVIRPVLWGAAVLALVMLAFNDQVLPRANHRLSVLQQDIARKKPTFALREQVINEVSGRLFIRPGHIDPATNALREVTIYDLSQPMTPRTIYADSGAMAVTENHRDLLLTLYDGYMQEVPRTDPAQLQRLFFAVDRIRVRGVGNTLERSQESDFKTDREMTICEMQAIVTKAELDRQLAEADLRETMTLSARRLTGAEDRLPDIDPPKPELGLAAAYCTVLAKLTGGVPPAEAAQAAAAARRALPPSAGGTLGFDHREEIDAGEAMSPEARAERREKQIARRVPAGAAGTRGLVAAATSQIRDAEHQMNTYLVEIHKKFALAAACVVFVLLGAPIALRFPRGGVGLVISVSLVVFALYYVGLIAGESLANRGIFSPFWAMWIANVIFTSIGLVLLVRMGREATTARGGDLSELLDAVRAWLARQARRFGIPLERRRRIA